MAGNIVRTSPMRKGEKRHTGTQLKHILSSVNRSVLGTCSEVIYSRCSLLAFGAFGDMSKVCFQIRLIKALLHSNSFQDV